MGQRESFRIPLKGKLALLSVFTCSFCPLSIACGHVPRSRTRCCLSCVCPPPSLGARILVPSSWDKLRGLSPASRLNQTESEESEEGKTKEATTAIETSSSLIIFISRSCDDEDEKMLSLSPPLAMTQKANRRTRRHPCMTSKGKGQGGQEVHKICRHAVQIVRTRRDVGSKVPKILRMSSLNAA